MPQNILIATLGEHPAVVTGMVKALREIAGIKNRYPACRAYPRIEETNRNLWLYAY